MGDPVVVTSSQIQLFPPAYMVKRFMDADEVIILDEAQYTKKQFFDHFVIRDQKGLVKNLKAQLKGGGGRTPLNELELFDYAAYRTQVMASLRDCYGGSPYFAQAINWLEGAWPERCEFLSDLAGQTLRALLRYLGGHARITHSLDIVPKRPEDPSEWIAGLAEHVGGNVYMQGQTAMDAYFDPAPFQRRGIDLFCQDWNAPTFVPQFPTGELSIVHGLFYVGRQRLSHLFSTARAIRSWPVQEEQQCVQ